MIIRRTMKIALMGVSLAMFAASAASAKTLVYCSEGSPEGFDTALYTAGTTFDASSKPVYNRLVEFKRGTTEVIPGLAESWSVSEDGLEYTFNLRKGVKFYVHEGDEQVLRRVRELENGTWVYERARAKAPTATPVPVTRED